MDPTLPDELRQLQGLVRRLIESEFIPLEREITDDASADWLVEPHRTRLRDRLRVLGLWALDAPVAVGGGGIDGLGRCVVTEEVYRSAVGRRLFASGYLPQFSVATAEQRERYVLPTVRGEIQGSAAMSEPDASGDLAALQTTAAKVEGGWVLNGTKTYISFAATAAYVLVMARLPGTSRQDGITWFIVERETPGYTVTRRQHMLGSTDTYELAFQDCFVADSQLLGEPGAGWGIGQGALGGGRVAIGARAIGMAVRSLQLATAYAQQRRTFGELLASRQAIQWMLADSAIEIHASRLMVYDTAWRGDHGEDIRQQIAMTKVFATEMAGRVVDRAIQVHGSAGLTDDTVLPRFYRDVRAMRIYEGPSEVQRFVIARNLLR